MSNWITTLSSASYLEKSSLKVILLVLFPLVYASYTLTLGQDTNWDLQNYHIYNAYAFLNNRHEFDLMPAGLQSFFNPVLDIIFWHTNSLFGPKGTGFIIALLQGSNISLIFLLTIRLFRAQQLSLVYVLPITVLALITPGFLSEAGTVFHDATVALFSTAALSVVVLAACRNADTGTQNTRYKLFVLAGFIVGLGCGLKPVLAVNALALCIACLLCGKDIRSQFINAFVFGLGTLAGIAVSGGFWLFEVWQLAGNPLFPQMNHIFGGELAMPLPMRDERFMPQGAIEAIFYPVFFTADPFQVAELPYYQLSWLLGFILFWWGGAVMLYRAGNGMTSENLISKPVRILFIYLVMTYLLWLKMFGIYRYLIPLEILLPVACFLVLAVTIKRLPHYCWLILLAAVGLYNLKGIPDWGHVGWSDELYSVEEPQDIDQVSTIYLMGQPLAWLVPSFPEEVPFIQISPNFSVSDIYWEQVRIRSNESGTLKVIFDPAVLTLEQTVNRIDMLGYRVLEDSCEVLNASLGQGSYSYQYCSVQTR